MSDEDQHDDRSTFGELTRTLVTDDVNMSDALGRVAATGCGLLDNCQSASVTLIEGDRAITVGSTSDVAQALDDAQYAASEGPCLTAARDGVLIRIDDIGVDARWPAFCGRALEFGVHSSLSVPLRVADTDTEGGFNLYGARAGGFSDDDVELCHAFAAQASIVVSNIHAYWRTLELALNLNKAMVSRASIEQAKGILMSTNRVGPEAAFELLRQRSQNENRKLRDVAADIVENVARDRDG